MELDLGIGDGEGEQVALAKKEVIWRCGLINGDALLLRRRDDIALCLSDLTEPNHV